MTYILYKNPIQQNTLAVVQYLHSRGQELLPAVCIERLHPDWATELPSIETGDGERFVGLQRCMEFYERSTGIKNLYHKAMAFNEQNPGYRVHV
jgi:hypothetical protein